MGLEYKCGLMEPNTKANGNSIKPTAKGSFGMQMVMSTKETGKKTKPTGKESMSMSMEPDTKDTGKTICKMATELNLGLTVLSIQVNTKKG